MPNPAQCRLVPFTGSISVGAKSQALQTFLNFLYAACPKGFTSLQLLQEKHNLSSLAYNTTDVRQRVHCACRLSWMVLQAWISEKYCWTLFPTRQLSEVSGSASSFAAEFKALTCEWYNCNLSRMPCLSAVISRNVSRVYVCHFKRTTSACLNLVLHLSSIQKPLPGLVAPFLRRRPCVQRIQNDSCDCSEIHIICDDEEKHVDLIAHTSPLYRWLHRQECL